MEVEVEVLPLCTDRNREYGQYSMLDLLGSSKDPRNQERKEKEENRNLGLIRKGEQGNQFRCTVFEGIQGTT